MKTIEERALKLFPIDMTGDEYGNDYDTNEDVRNGYILGAKEQAKISDDFYNEELHKMAEHSRKCQEDLIIKACNWLNNNLLGYNEFELEDIIEEFHKAMNK